MISRMRCWMAAIVVSCMAVNTLASEEPAKLSEKERKELDVERNRLWDKADRLEREGKIREAVDIAETATQIERRMFGDGHEEIANDLEWLADRYERLDDFAAARKCRTGAPENKWHRLGEDHWKVTDARLWLAHTDLLAQLTPEQKRLLKEANGLLAQVSLLEGQGNYAKAIPLSQRAWELRRSVLGEEHWDVGNAALSLARDYEYSGDKGRGPSRSIAKYLEIHKQSLGESTPTTLWP